MPSNPFDNSSPLTIELVGIPLVALLPAIFKPTAFMVLEHPMFATEMPLTEAAVTDNPLCLLFAFLEAASNFLRRHSAANGKEEMECAVGCDV